MGQGVKKMEIGLTYDIREFYEPTPALPRDYYGEYDSAETVTILRETLNVLGYRVTEIGNIKHLTRFLAAGGTVDLVFNIAEGVWGRSREAQVPALLEAYRIPYTFSDPLTLGICLDKVITKKLLMQHGILTPQYFVATDQSQSLTQAKSLTWPLFVKPSQEGTSKGIDHQAMVSNELTLAARVQWVLQEYRQPVLVEEHLPGPEFTVGVLGTGKQARAIGAVEIAIIDGKDVYGFLQKEECESRVQYTPVKAQRILKLLSQLALEAYRAMGCRDAGRVDIRLDRKGRYHVLEVNPLAGLHPTHSDLSIIAEHEGISYEDLVAEILSHAIQRL